MAEKSQDGRKAQSHQTGWQMFGHPVCVIPILDTHFLLFMRESVANWNIWTVHFRIEKHAMFITRSMQYLSITSMLNN